MNFKVDTENYLGFEEILDFETNRKNGFIYIKIDKFLKAHDFKIMLDEIQKEVTLRLYDYSSSEFSVDKKFVCDRFIMSVIGNKRDIGLSFYCKTEEDLLYLTSLYNKYSIQDEDSSVTAFFDTLYVKGAGLDKTTKVLKYKDVKNISELYYPFLEADNFVQQFCTGNENILIITGEAGIGKTKLINLIIKKLIENPENIPYNKMESNPDLEMNFINVVYVKSTDILVRDDFWRTLQTDLPDFVILDDLDYMLTKRDSEVMTSEDAKKNIFLNQLLSFTDGMHKNNTKFIITTNQKFDDVDDAVLRKGRLFNIFEFRKLKSSEAKEIWISEELQESDFEKTFSNSEITAAELGSEIAKRKNSRISKEKILDSYLKEDGISKMKRKPQRMTL